MEAAVKGYIEQVCTLGIQRATLVVLDACMEDHLGDELVGEEPGGGAHVGQRLAKAAIGYVGAHVGVHVEMVAIFEKSHVELRRQGVHIHRHGSVALENGSDRLDIVWVRFLGRVRRDVSPGFSGTTSGLEATEEHKKPGREKEQKQDNIATDEVSVRRFFVFRMLLLLGPWSCRYLLSEKHTDRREGDIRWEIRDWNSERKKDSTGV